MVKPARVNETRKGKFTDRVRPIHEHARDFALRNAQEYRLDAWTLSRRSERYEKHIVREEDSLLHQSKLASTHERSPPG